MVVEEPGGPLRTFPFRTLRVFVGTVRRWGRSIFTFPFTGLQLQGRPLLRSEQTAPILLTFDLAVEHCYRALLIPIPGAYIDCDAVPVQLSGALLTVPMRYRSDVANLPYCVDSPH